ncbi:MAG: phosphoenolpyruvate--protein phosphotransferase [Spirochaetales bacterium]
MRSPGPDFASLLEQSSGLQDFLRRAVDHLGDLFAVQACSIFLYDAANQRLTLRASSGLNPEAVGVLSLGIDEGLVGYALREQVPVLEVNPQSNPQFKPFAEVQEDQYHSFLAVPILKGTTPVGVVTLHDRATAAFGERQVRELREMTSALAASLENVQMLFDLKAGADEPDLPSLPKVKPEVIRGRGASEGIAIGSAVLLGTTGINLYLELTPGETYHSNLQSFQTALSRSIGQLEELQIETERKLTDVASLIFSTHILMLKDSSFSGSMEEEIVLRRLPAAEAVVKVVNQYVDIFRKSPSTLLKEKIQDVKDLGHRLLRNLNQGELPDGDYYGQIVVAQELLPSELIKIAAQHAEGMLLFGGGASAHVSILARSLGIPVIFTDDKSLFLITEGDQLVLDGIIGNVYLNPKPEAMDQFRQVKAAYAEAQLHASLVHEGTHTRDGIKVKLLANVNLLSDLAIAKRLKAEGVGLYRSEFPFIIRNDFPTEEEQYKVYRTIITEMAGQEVVLRTLDIGGDKVLSYMPQSSESNPFLGLRAIRFSLKNIAVFHEQLRAMLRAGEAHELRIMFPLISSLDDFLEAREHVFACIAQLRTAGQPHNPKPLIGAMIELPSACEVANELALEADFLCVGTNDLVQYILGVDRTNEEVSNLYTAYHPAVYRTLQRVVRAAVNHNTSISICGEIAADPYMIPFLLGSGIRKLSVNPKLLPGVQKLIEGLSLRECQVGAEKLVHMGSIKDIHHYLGIPSAEKP